MVSWKRKRTDVMQPADVQTQIAEGPAWATKNIEVFLKYTLNKKKNYNLHANN